MLLKFLKRLFGDVPNVDDLIDPVIARMKKVGPNSEEYPNLMRSLERLEGMKTVNRRKPLDWNTVLSTLGSLAGIVLILNFERLGVVTSKAIMYIKRTAL